MNIAGYQITEQIQASLNTLVYRAVREQSRNTVIIKTIKADYPTLEEITRLRHEYKILQNLNIEGIIKPLALENYRNGLALILEDFSGRSLKDFILEQKIDLTSFLSIAIQLASALGQLHQNQIIHKDIKPHNIIINAATGQLKIIDFSIASRLYRENPTLSNPNLLEGTLAYMSPEQTGRMNRALDYRSDFYSLGITFYEMLTGQLPFNSSDPLELVHCHIAFPPAPPHQINPEIPLAVSHIVMKLLAKTAEERYQSAWGLKADLETCLTQLQATGKIENFPPGKQDLIGQFLIPQKLYGRANQVKTLMEAFGRVASGASEMMLVSGYSGIGKTSVVNEIHKPIVRQRGYFISGKFDQFKRNIPYASLIQAFQQLTQQILTESPAKIAIWKEQLLAAFGQQGNVIIDVIPEIELIVGPQPPVPQLGPTESQNRFNRVFREFIHVFTKAEHPLVVFLDDLQWADSASLKLIQLLITDPDSQYLLLIGAYRDNEVFPTHPLLVTLDEIKNTGATLTNITLRPLDIENASELVGETLHADTERSQPLAELVYNKTQGNPFFLTQLLSTLHQEKLLAFDFKAGYWQWDIKQIQAVGITDYNVVELIARHIQKLPEPTQNVLKLAACVGDKFNLDVLAIVNEKSSSETATDLWDALQAGLILPLSQSYKIPLVFDSSTSLVMPVESLKIRYKFLHDRVQQAAYSLIHESQKKATHLKIGQLLQKNASEAEIEENIFEIVNQLNVGIEFISNPAEKYELARLNSVAARKAKAANAYEPALKYITVGLGLLASDSWQSRYELTLALYVEAVETEYLNGNFDRANSYAEIVLQQAKNLLDKIRVYELKIQLCVTQMQIQLAIDTGLQALQLLGVILEKEPPKQLNFDKLANLPKMTDPYKLAAMRMLVSNINAAFSTNIILLSQLIFTMIDLSIKYGNSPQGAYAYCLYGMLLCSRMGDINTGYQFGKLSLQLLDVFSATEYKTKILCFFDGCVRHWKESAQETLELLLQGILTGIETGDIEHAGYCTNQYCNHTLFTGKHLEFTEKRFTQYIELMKKLNHTLVFNYISITKQFISQMLKNKHKELNLVGKNFNEVEMLPVLEEQNNANILFLLYVMKTILAYFFKAPSLALANAKTGEKYAGIGVGLLLSAEYNLYFSLALLAVYPNTEKEQQDEYLNKVEANQENMKLWAHHVPANFQHKYDLVEAEKARVLGEIGRAMEYYDRAIEGARDSGYTQLEALANELAAEFYFERGKEKIAQIYLTDAYYGYIRWGAKAKVRDLEDRYSEFFLRMLAREIPDRQEMPTIDATTSGSGAVLDLTTVIKASQAISSEIVLDKLLSKLMHILLENAGAQKGILLLVKSENLVVAAEKLADREEVLLPSTPVENPDNLPLSIINYVERTQKNIVLNDATREINLVNDTYITKNQVKSLLCAPILHQGKLVGIVYLENNLTKSAFTPERLEILRMLSAQAAISLELARSVNEVQDTVAYLKAIINHIADGLLVTDILGTITHVNPALLAMFEMEATDAIAKDCQSVFNSQIAAFLTKARECLNDILTAEVELANGKIGKAVATAISKSTSGEESAIPTCLGSVTIIRDITQEKEIDRMKTDFISTVSHELRTPLTSVLGFAKLILKKLDDAILPVVPESDRKAQRACKQVNQNINIIISEGERLTNLINDVLDIAKMEAGKIEWNMQPTSIGEII
ncbi:AAA family ATPase, partial [Aerosakkonema sp. BLCC-F183]|uniref:AAA family ATPase n=1 Tax=Aerosakkonema sp. BLCC-F183 TaxID=3342834 RepID=UPI0035BAC1DC